MRVSNVIMAAPASFILSVALPAQGTTNKPDSSSSTGATQQAAPAPPRASVSGVLFLNYQYGGPRTARSQNRFDIDRAYVTVRAAAGASDSVRITMDVFQQRDDARDDFYTGWAARFKYAYLNHTFVNQSDGWGIQARLGLIQTVVIEQEEQFWPRGLSPVAVDLNGFFNSADAGAGVEIAFPNEMGEIYTTIINGAGYTSRETDRYKDFQSRMTLTPWASGTGPLRGLQFTPWFSFGGRASDFITRKGTVAPVADARRKHRFGFLTTFRNPKLVLGAQVARRLEVAETADTTRDVVPVTRDVTGNLTSMFGFFRPLATATRSSPWSLLFRIDDVQPDNATDASNHRYFVGTTWDLSSRTSVTFDVQSLFPKGGMAGVPSRTFFLHLISNF